MPYAARTEVSEERSQAAIKDMLRRLDCDGIGFCETRTHTGVQFAVAGVTYLMRIALPQREAKEFRRTETGRTRKDAATVENAWAQELRRRWRCLVAVVKAKLIAVEDGVATIEEEFLPYVLMADGRTLAEAALPEIRAAAADGRLPQQVMLALPEGGGGRD